MATFPAITVLIVRASIAAMNRPLTLPLLTGLIGIGSPLMATAVEAPSELQEMLCTYWRELGFQLMADRYFSLPPFLHCLSCAALCGPHVSC